MVHFLLLDEYNNLTNLEKLILYYCGKANNFSEHSHIPKEFFINKVKKIENIKERIINRAFKQLISQGFILKHPTRGGETYNLTPKGLKGAIRAKMEIEST